MTTVDVAFVYFYTTNYSTFSYDGAIGNGILLFILVIVTSITICAEISDIVNFEKFKSYEKDNNRNS